MNQILKAKGSKCMLTVFETLPLHCENNFDHLS